MCIKINNKLIFSSKVIIALFSLLQSGLLAMVVVISRDFQNEEIYNIDDLKLSQYRVQAEAIGFILILVALVASILGLMLISHPRICC